MAAVMDAAALPLPAPGPVGVVWSPHPLLAAAGRELHHLAPIPGETIAELLERAGVRARAYPLALWLNDRQVAPELWEVVCPRPGDLVAVRAVVGDSGDGSDPLRIVLQLGLMILAPQVAPFLFGAEAAGMAVIGTITLGQIVSGVVTIAGGLLINALLPPPRPDLSRASGRLDQPSPTYSLAGGANRARPYEPLPWVMGRHRITMDLAARPFTEIEGTDQYLYQVFHAGLGDVLLSDFRIGDTPVSAYQGVEIQVSGPDGRLTLFPGNVDTVAGGGLTFDAGWIQRTSSDHAVALAVEVQGSVYWVSDDGLAPASVVIEIEHRRVGEATWTPLAYGQQTLLHANYWSAGRWETYYVADDEGIPSVLVEEWVQVAYGSTDPAAHTAGEAYGSDDAWRWRPYDEIAGGPDGSLTEAAPARAYQVQVAQLTITSSSTTPVRRTYKASVPEGQYEVRVRRVSPEVTDPAVVKTITWTQLRTYQPDQGDYTGQTRVALKIKASGQLQGTVDQFRALATARTQHWDGVGTWAQVQTSNPAWWILAVARGIRINGRLVAGAGLADAQIDLDAIKAFGAWCVRKQLTFDGVFDRAMTVGDMLSAIARCGRGSITRATGKLGVIWDEGGQPIVAIYGMPNIRRRTFQVQYVTGQIAEEVAVGFVNPDLDWQRDEVRAPVPGIASPASTVTIELFGCTSKDMAGREANLLAANHAYRRRFVTWETDVEGLIPARGDVVGMSHDLTAWGYSGRLVAGTTTALTLDREVSFTPGQQHYALVRAPDGSFDVYRVAFAAGPTASITLEEPLPAAPDDDANHRPHDYLWFFEPRPTPGRKLKVTQVAPQSLHHVKITAVDEQDAYYLQETNAYTHVPPGTVVGGELPALSGLHVAESLVRAGAVYVVQLSITWDASGLYDHAIVSGGPVGEPMRELGRTFARQFEWTVPDGGSVQIEVLAVDALGRFQSSGRASVTYEVSGSAARPADVPWAAIDGDVFTWGEVNAADLAGYRWRYLPGNARDWEVATPLHTGLVAGGPWSPAVRPRGTTTFMVKAVDTGGRESAGVAAIVTELGDPLVANLIETIDLKAGGFPGTLTRCSVSGGNLVADDASGLAWSADPDTPGWTVDSDPGWDSAVYHLMVYEAQFTPDAAPAGSKITLEATIVGSPYQIDWRRNGDIAGWTSDTDPGWGADDGALAWSTPDYQPWPGQVLSSHEAYDLRITIAQGPVQGQVTALSVVIDAPDIEETFDDLAIAGAGTRLPIAATYTAIKNVQVTLQADGGAGRTVEIIDKDESLGPLVKVFDSSHSATTGVVDARIQGY